jgi:hypothetical protein
VLAFTFGAVMIGSVLAEDKLPTDPETSFDIEPPLLIKDRALGPLPESAATPTPIASIDLEQLEAKLERAKRNAAAGERLWKMGVLAKVEAENRALRVTRLKADMENARLECAKVRAIAEESRFQAGEISKADLELAKSAVASATASAKTSMVERQRAELEAAMLDVRRQQKLLDLGSGRKSAVNRAEERLAALKANN